MTTQPEALPPLPERAGLVGRYLTNDCHSEWFFVPERPAWGWARSEEAKLRGVESTEEVYTADQMRAYAQQHIAALEQEIARQKEVIASVNARCDHLGMSLRDIKADRDSWAQQASDRTQDAVDLVAAERERCAKLCESIDEPYLNSRYDYRRGVLDCADAIRKGNG